MQASGEATYVDDMPSLRNELYAGLVMSTRAHAKLLSVDASEAVAMPGVWGFVSARDVGAGESNMFGVGPVIDEPVFAQDEVSWDRRERVLVCDHLFLACHCRLCAEASSLDWCWLLTSCSPSELLSESVSPTRSSPPS